MKLILLGRKDLDLAASEALALVQGRQDDNVLLTGSQADLFSRLAYSHAVYDFLFSCRKEDLVSFIGSFDFDRQCGRDFCVRKVGDSEMPEKLLAGLVHARIKKPKVNLKYPSTVFFFIFTRKRVYCCTKESRIDKSFILRKPHMRPMHMPISLDPRLARLMVNLTGIRRGTVLDPFCGTGGILIEAGLMGFKTIGFDTDPRMVRMTEQNLLHYGVTDARISHRDALTMPKTRYVVTDLPYSKNTKKIDISKLYKSFFAVLKNRLTGTAVVSVPNSMGADKFIRLRIEKVFLHYIHRSMTKKILVLKA